MATIHMNNEPDYKPPPPEPIVMHEPAPTLLDACKMVLAAINKADEEKYDECKWEAFSYTLDRQMIEDAIAATPPPVRPR